MIEYIILNCPKISTKLEGKVNKKAVFHSEVTRILGKEDCNLSKEILDKWEAELSSKRVSANIRGGVSTSKKTARVEKKPVKSDPVQLELDLQRSNAFKETKVG